MKRRTLFEAAASLAFLGFAPVARSAGAALGGAGLGRTLVLGRLAALHDLAGTGGVAVGDHVRVREGMFQIAAATPGAGNDDTVVDLPGGGLQAVLCAEECVATVQALLADTRLPEWFKPGDVLRTRAEGFIYEILPVDATGFHLKTAGGTALRLTGRGQFRPEAFGARGNGQDDDTEAWNRLIAAVAEASREGPVHVEARGSYLLDQLAPISQYGGSAGTLESSLSLDFRGARFRHSGRGAGLFDLEGHNVDRARVALRGGVFEGTGAGNSRFAVRLRDLRGSLIQPEALIGFEYGVLAQIWRTWSENVSYGGDEALEGRQCRHVLAFQGRTEAWAHQIALDGGPDLDVASYLGARDAGPAGAGAGDFYFDTTAGLVRVHDGSLWQDCLTVSDVDASVSGRSFARTRISNVLIAHAADPAAEGQLLHVDGASLYDSLVDYLRGNTPNGGGSLIYLNDGFLLHSVIENVGVEMANDPDEPRSFAVRTGPKYADSIRPPLIRNVNWIGGHALPTDPAAGLPIDGEQPGLLNLGARVAETVVPAGILHAGTTLRVTLRDGEGAVLAQAMIARRAESGISAVFDAMGCSYFLPVTAAGGEGFVAPRPGFVVGLARTSAGRASVSCVVDRGGAGADRIALGDDGLQEFGRADPKALAAREFAAGDVLSGEADGRRIPDDFQAQVELRLDGPVSWRAGRTGDILVTSPTDQKNVRCFFEVLRG